MYFLQGSVVTDTAVSRSKGQRSTCYWCLK